jgi:integrase
MRSDCAAAAGIGEGWTPRELRHTFVSIMSDNDVPIEKIADLVGHRATIVTQTPLPGHRALRLERPGPAIPPGPGATAAPALR